MNMRITLLRDRASYTPAEKALIQGIIDGGINTVDILLSFSRDEVVRLLGMSPEKLPMLEEILIREGFRVGMTEAELEHAHMRILTPAEKALYLFPPPLGME